MTDGPGTPAGSAAFWSWWGSARPRVEEAFASGSLAVIGDEITAQVRRLHPDLQWELAPDDDAVHALCISGAGDPALRAMAVRIVQAGPGDDARWAYHSVRLPHPSTIDQDLALAGEQLALADTRFSIRVDEERQVLDLVVHHPTFGRLDPRQQTTVAFLVIDGILGEDGVERWIGKVDVAESSLADGLPGSALAEAADGLAERHTEPSWCLMSGSSPDGQSLFVMARRPLKRVEAPTFDLHAAVMLIGYSTNETGLPTTSSLERLTALEDGLTAALDGDGLVAAHVTVAGRRTTHLYCDQFGPAPALISAWSSTLAEDEIEAVVSFELDPAWDAVGPFR